MHGSIGLSCYMIILYTVKPTHDSYLSYTLKRVDNNSDVLCSASLN